MYKSEVIDGLDYIRSITEESRNVYLLTAAIDLLKSYMEGVADLESKVIKAQDFNLKLDKLNQALIKEEDKQAAEIERLESKVIKALDFNLKLDKQAAEIERLTRKITEHNESLDKPGMACLLPSNYKINLPETE
jgi:predicted RNase H-like nuclease (RuvC/YqgF family)